jgi:regulator of protease activity HflC (stomatin/prohibitin superfamily)
MAQIVSGNFEYRRSRIGLSTQKIANMLGVVPGTVRNMELGRWSYYSGDYDRVLVEKTGERLRELLGELSFDQLMDLMREQLRERIDDGRDQGPEVAAA